MIRVLVEHNAKSKADAEKAIDVIHQLRNEAMKQPGYITGETLINSEDPENVVVISTWNKEENWHTWDTSKIRIEITQDINPLLKVPYTVRIYLFATAKSGRVNSIF